MRPHGLRARVILAAAVAIVVAVVLLALAVPALLSRQLEDSLRGTEAPQEEMERRTVVRQTLTGLAALPERQREALVLCHYQELPQGEAAALMGLSVDALESLLARARRTLRAQLAPLGGSPE